MFILVKYSGFKKLCFAGKFLKEKKGKKRKCSIQLEGKCDAIFFWKKYGRFLLFTHIVFSKNPLWARYCQRIFPGRIPLLSFFLFFCRGSASYFLTKTLENCARSYDNDTNRKEGRKGKDSGVPFGLVEGKAHDCALWRKCIDGKPFDRLRVRAVNDGYILEELGKALAKWGNRIAEKWWGSTGSPTENLYLDNCLKKRRERQWY